MGLCGHAAPAQVRAHAHLHVFRAPGTLLQAGIQRATRVVDSLLVAGCAQGVEAGENQVGGGRRESSIFMLKRAFDHC